MNRYIGLDKLGKALDLIHANGGIRASLRKLYRMSTLKTGYLVGQDKYGNRYYEDRTQFFPRSRWVVYAEHFGESYDASQLPAEWFGWMHHSTDRAPNRDGKRVKYPWMLDHSENLSGTKYAYMPYSTTTPKVEAWVPPKDSSKNV
ncbi:probable NADH dehydrogenase [ubiquinone] 1 alpha subcomplex subunit 12 [Wyeomyia smithii]|uniref:probable NADH dehydrogenase [ubiquinone] 1 alpha subcomplex subunit 12 n=1 Tax=Wyeomyia smithii TaxID=174621 RepID=UPI002467DD32|nr:probable NADH dehydrogenase [ubiquinone] 1 alpha subcomplex subunit 12 [Wyeomyia smithii]